MAASAYVVPPTLGAAPGTISRNSTGGMGKTPEPLLDFFLQQDADRDGARQQDELDGERLQAPWPGAERRQPGDMPEVIRERMASDKGGGACEAIAEAHGLNPANIMAFNGSGEILALLRRNSSGVLPKMRQAAAASARC